MTEDMFDDLINDPTKFTKWADWIEMMQTKELEQYGPCPIEKMGHIEIIYEDGSKADIDLSSHTCTNSSEGQLCDH